MDIFSMVSIAKERNASDLHLSAGSVPMVRVRGQLEPLNGNIQITHAEMQQSLDKITTLEEKESFRKEKELDFAFTVPQVSRLRCNAAVNRGHVSLSLRLISEKIPSLEELHLPDLCKELITKPRGLIIVSGPTGSGKSTTLASMIEHLNHSQCRRVITIEDPLEYIFANDKCSILQRELGSDTNSFSLALKHVLRQDPDVIMVGEMRDTETAQSALILAETGHLVLSTGHAPSSYQAVDRVIDLFPFYERNFAQTRMANLLVGIMCQTLVPALDGEGRVPAVELLLANTAVRSLIRDGKIHHLPNVIRTSAQEGMMMLDQSLVNLYSLGLISGTNLLAYCNDRSEVEKLIGDINVKLNRRKEPPPATDNPPAAVERPPIFAK